MEFMLKKLYSRGGSFISRQQQNPVQNNEWGGSYTNLRLGTLVELILYNLYNSEIPS